VGEEAQATAVATEQLRESVLHAVRTSSAEADRHAAARP
jgi:hypothetical protein